jgi:hypothetical protein
MSVDKFNETMNRLYQRYLSTGGTQDADKFMKNQFGLF